MKTLLFSFALLIPFALYAEGLSGDDILKNWKTFEAAKLKEKANSEAIKTIRALSKNPYASNARSLMIRFGDPEVIDAVLKDYRGENPSLSGAAYRSLRNSNQPLLIPLLEKDFANNEISAPELVGGDQLVDPLSVKSARVAQAIILGSPEFSESLKNWASSLPKKIDGGALRGSILLWFTQNKPFFVSGDFKLMKPPTEVGEVLKSMPEPDAGFSPTVSKPSPTPPPLRSNSSEKKKPGDLLYALLALPVVAALYFYKRVQR